MKPKTILYTLLALALITALAYLAIESNLGGWFSTSSATPTATQTRDTGLLDTETLTPTFTQTVTATPTTTLTETPTTTPTPVPYIPPTETPKAEQLTNEPALPPTPPNEQPEG